MNGEVELRNYPELKTYLESSDETKTTLKNLLRVLKTELICLNANKPFNMLDIGSSDGELTLPLVDSLREQFPDFKITALEPEKSAFKKFVKETKDKKVFKAKNLTVQEFLHKNEYGKESYNFIFYSQCWYHFPKKEWDYIFNRSLALLKKNGIIAIVLDSHQGAAYKLKDLITGGKADTLEYGDLFSAEDVENFMDKKGVKYSTFSFPIYVFIKNNNEKLINFSRTLAFLYRTFPDEILKYKSEVQRFLEENRNSHLYSLENRVKAIIVRKQKSCSA